ANCSPRARSALALGAVESRAPGLHETLDAATPVAGPPVLFAPILCAPILCIGGLCCGANATGTGLALAILDRAVMREPAELARGRHRAARRRAAGGERARQHVLARVREPGRALALHARREASWRYARLEQGFARVDVADARDDALVEQRCLDRR